MHEDYMLTFEDFTYNNQKHEFVVKVPKTKSNVEGRTFIVQQKLHVDLLQQYISMIVHKVGSTKPTTIATKDFIPKVVDDRG